MQWLQNVNKLEIYWLQDMQIYIYTTVFWELIDCEQTDIFIVNLLIKTAEQAGLIYKRAPERHRRGISKKQFQDRRRILGWRVNASSGMIVCASCLLYLYIPNLKSLFFIFYDFERGIFGIFFCLLSDSSVSEDAGNYWQSDSLTSRLVSYSNGDIFLLFLMINVILK